MGYKKGEGEIIFILQVAIVVRQMHFVFSVVFCFVFCLFACNL